MKYSIIFSLILNCLILFILFLSSLQQTIILSFNFSKHIILYLQRILLIFEKFGIDINSNPSITPITKILLSIINFAEKYYLYYLNILINDYINNNNYLQKYKI